MRSLLLHHKSYRRLVRMLIVRAVRRWETRPLARRKQEVVAAGIVALLCMLSSVLYQPGHALQNPNSGLSPLRVLRETRSPLPPPVRTDTVTRHQIDAVNLQPIEARQKRLMTLLEKHRASRTSPPAPGQLPQAPPVRTDTVRHF